MAAARSVRRNALARLALLSAASDTPKAAAADIAKLSQSIPSAKGAGKQQANGPDPASVGRVPMTLRELEVLLALCDAAPSIKDYNNASRLLQQLSPYMSECCYQVILPSPFLRQIDPSPWERLSNALANALLNIGIHHPALQERVAEALSSYLDNCIRLVSYIARPRLNDEHWVEDLSANTESSSTLVLMTSLLGFLHAAEKNVRFWTLLQRRELIQLLHGALTDAFFVAVEGSFSSMRNSKSSNRSGRDAKQYMKRYAVLGRPLGATLVRQRFMAFVESCAALLVVDPNKYQDQNVLELMLSRRGKRDRLRPSKDEFTSETLANIAADELQRLEEGSDYIHLGSAWQQQLAHKVKSSCLVTFVCCCIASEDVADPDTLISWLEDILGDPVQAGDETLAANALRSLSALANISYLDSSKLSRALHRLLVRGNLSQRTATVAAECLTFVLRFLPQDTVITTLYGLGNSLSTSKSTEFHTGSLGGNDAPVESAANVHMNGHLGLDSSLDLATESNDQLSIIQNTIITAVVTVAKGFRDEKITALALSMLIQKVGKISVPLDLKIITEAARLATDSGTAEFRALLRLYSRLSQDGLRKKDTPLLNAVSAARDYMSTTLKGGTELYEIYLQHLLETIISKGDSLGHNTTLKQDMDWAPEEIAMLLRPLALLVASNLSTEGIRDSENFATLQRDAWYNVVVHGFSTKSTLGRRHLDELKILAKYTQGLISEERADRLESDVELNTVLRRGSHSHKVEGYRKEMIELLPQCESELKELNYPELMLLKAAYTVEVLRAASGDCTTILSYFVDPDLRKGALGNCMTFVALATVDAFVSNTTSGDLEAYSAPFAAQQLSTILERCCHRVEKVQHVAYLCADHIINQVPSALCHRTSIFALLDLLTIMWASCLESETDEYEWKSTYTSLQGTTRIQLSDDFNFRRYTLKTFHKRARGWVTKAVNISPLDIKGLLQTYLSDYGDDDTFGHMSLGRSFAFEMGAMVPLTDQRLGAIETEQDLNINTASDFMAQYTSRQEYRFTDPTRTNNFETGNQSSMGASARTSSFSQDSETQDIVSAMTHVEKRIAERGQGIAAELREVLRRAAALLCGALDDESATVAYFVRLPFSIFSKQSIKLGLSLWMGVIKENPRVESKILLEIFEGWISTIHAKLGIFSESLRYPDPFFSKEEFAPSDKDMISKQQQRVHDRIAPHFRILQFLSSHYTATRMTSPSLESAYHRFLKETLRALRSTYSHPLAREVHFHIVWLGLRFLRHSTHLTLTAQWRLKDDILSAGLAWFRRSPRWSFGGNRLQVKAETHILSDVAAALQAASTIGARGSSTLKSLQQKQQLFQLLIANEQTRLMVWLFPMDHNKRHLFTSGLQARASDETRVTSLLRTAWDEDPAIAIQLPARFQSQSIIDGVRQLIMDHPEMSRREPEALNILLGSSLPSDVNRQLKYLMYWAPVNPITAVTLFLPAYGNHPSVIQYAVRALESHPVDVTFFYVPQIVQTLRYDMLRYVERYIIETAKFSQLFAHQIIWNMKANAYKDEDSEVPDPVKPTLDRVMNSLISSFSSVDRAFYEREFSFFNEITGISGKLRPFIKKSKAEKKQKIEEELRLVQVDVGVYLPSNPDGIVVGIDRKSGRPLQSHAKAPFMATFRIKKEKEDDLEQTEEQLEELKSGQSPLSRPQNPFEVWQSAIFKVGDDCRQDVLALQLIAAFRGIFHSVGLPVYVFPYRVTATAPGCGVIDVLPASISRDMLGREAVNGLYEWFRSKFGGEDAPAFQVARANFVKSLAAYSVISYLLQFKDRHNGNIMFDEQGHILHIDFGFCFDIAPGGVAFERAPFKLTKEMIAVMGGRGSQSFRWFEELCVKVFLASRLYVSTLSDMVTVMMDSGLPCFKPETIQHLKERFVLEKTETEAAAFMLGLVDKSFASVYTKGYDWFQLKTNGIPY